MCRTLYKELGLQINMHKIFLSLEGGKFAISNRADLCVKHQDSKIDGAHFTEEIILNLGIKS